jgi:hypothetical protein
VKNSTRNTWFATISTMDSARCRRVEPRAREPRIGHERNAQTTMNVKGIHSSERTPVPCATPKTETPRRVAATIMYWCAVSTSHTATHASRNTAARGK